MSVSSVIKSSDSSQTMSAVVLYDVGRLELRDVPCPKISSHEVLIRVAAVGLCGTDAHIFAGHANYNTDEYGAPVPLAVQPQILGHEISGIVEELGKSVSDLEVGDRVVVDQGLNCISRRREVLCEYCLTGDSHQCVFYSEHGITGLPGALAEFIAVPAVNAIKISSDLEFSAAALTEPLGCVIHSSDAVTRARTRHVLNGETADRRVRSVLICGAGPAGLLFTQYLRNVLGFEGSVLVSDPNPAKRKLAESFGADKTIDPANDDLVSTVKDHTGGKGVEYLIEASGAGAALRQIPGLICKQATVLLYGHGHAGHDLSVLNSVLFKEPVLVAAVGASGGFEADGRPSVYTRALKLIEEEKIEVQSLITHEYRSLGMVERALATEMNSAGYVKGVVVI